ncbi:two component transcriptional regulator, LuxR family [Desulfacinum hydrothermale DSM 13146]|uniref:Two component transcriptional regulator, LuxR family n=1 Tax=Desulfacinum hydrothermale DSM 13146 TaxID=1121390 RepID=A0A1W1XTA0_9BACT|nr:DNA-binding response regulator [Desulfacinum hydrothermale]SMC26758.1 two component transcriptional regulator, LuxR family [Desulfacinum hydrothermale DSM 13146]
MKSTDTRPLALAEGRTPSVVVIDDEGMLRATLTELLASWGMEAESFDTPAQFLAWGAPPSACQVILLDIYFPNDNGLTALPKIKDRFPDAKVIMVTGAGDKQSAIQALKLGAFDYLEKPFQAEDLKHAITKALDARRREQEVIQLLGQLRESEKQLLEQNRRLKQLNEQLLNTNKAMAVLARNLSVEREETQRRLALQLRSIVLPIVERMALDARLRPKMEQLENALNEMIQELASGETMDGRIVGSLTQTELRVASFIRSGLTTEEIARQMNVSLSTVKTHRRNIRKKLGITDPKADLRAHLAVHSPGSPPSADPSRHA